MALGSSCLFNLLFQDTDAIEGFPYDDLGDIYHCSNYVGQKSAVRFVKKRKRKKKALAKLKTLLKEEIQVLLLSICTGTLS